MFALVLAPVLAFVSPSPPAPTCNLPQTTQTAQHAPTRVQKLGDLPDAEMDLAVVRSIDGCWVRQVVRFHVSDPNPQIAPEGGFRLPGIKGTLVPGGPAGQRAQPVR